METGKRCPDLLACYNPFHNWVVLYSIILMCTAPSMQNHFSRVFDHSSNDL